MSEGFAMISKKRVTFLRSLKLVSTFILCTLVVYLAVGFAYNNSPLAVEHTAGSKYHKTRLPLQAGIPRKPLRPLDCKLHRLRGKTNITRKRHFISPKCKRVEPSPESCRIAEELFHNLPPGNCEHQTSHKFCSLLKHADAYSVQCWPEQCQAQLAAATVDVQTGEMQWKNFKSASHLEKWITQLLKPSRKKTHFGFCFIACDAAIEKDVDGYDRFLHRISQDDDVPFVDASVQLLILPPSGQLRSPEHRWERNLMNINILFIDSVSRQHFFRSLPRTVHFLEKLQSNETSRTSVIDFELVQAVRSRTFETYQTLFEGEIDPSVKPFGTMEFPPEPLGVEHLLKKLKQKGYGTLWLEDLCYQWEWGLSKDLLVHNRSLSREQTWHKFHKALSRAHIDSVEVTYAMCKILIDNGVPDPFHGPDAVCENGRHQHEYFLEYLALYQNVMQMAQQPYFSILVTDAGHEGTGRRIQTLDVALKQYLQQAATQDNTLTVLMSDHGNSYGDFLERSTEGRFELFHPFLIMIVPDGVATSLGKKAMDALHTNQYRLVSVLDLYYTLEAIATDYKNTVSAGHKEYGVTSRGLLDQISPERTCRNIPRIMPNLCICENFDMPVESDEYHGLFAHLAVGRLNNEIQRQFLQTSLPQGVVRAFGHCQHLRLKEFKNVWKSFSKDTLSLKMDLVLEPEHQLFFVSMQAEFASNNANSRIILEKVDRISPYSKFAACADEKVRLQLCICNTNTTKDKVLQTDLPTQEDLDDDVLGLQSEVFVAQNTDNCLLLVQRRCEHGGIFSVVNTCSDRVFHFKFELQTSEMYVSDKVPIEDAVYPGQEIFLCMAIKSSPKAKWGWSFSLRHSVQFL